MKKIFTLLALTIVFSLYTVAQVTEYGSIELDEKLQKELIKISTDDLDGDEFEVDTSDDFINEHDENLGTESEEGEDLLEDTLEVYEPSIIESRLSVESDTLIKQFGYNYLFLDENIPSLTSNSNYILGPGDSLKAYVWGDPVDILELKGQYNLKVNRDGGLYFPAVGIIDVTGKSVLEVENIIIAGLKEKYRRFNLELVVSGFKSFPVSVSGMVNRPGQIKCTALTTLVNALGMAEGVTKEGSLRNILVKRGDKEFYFDLYDILVNGNGDSNLTSFLLKSGDFVYVNPIGAVAAVKGGVKREGIYELKGGESVDDLISFAGGSLVSTLDRGVNVYTLDKTSGHLKSVVLNEDSILNFKVIDGTIIDIPEALISYSDSIVVDGCIKNPGRFSLQNNMDLLALLNNIEFTVDTNMSYATILRHPNEDNGQTIITFSPKDILNGTKELKLEMLDEVIFYPEWEYEPIILTGEVKTSYSLTYFPGVSLIEVFRGIEFKTPVEELRARIIQDDEVFYIYLYDLLVLGSPQSDLKLKPGASVLVQKVTDRENRSQVKVLGQVNKPGIVTYNNNMTLYDLLKTDAEGFRGDAYLKGLVVIRKSAKESQEKQLELSLNTMASQLESMKTEALNSSLSPEAKAAVSAQIVSQEALLELTREKAKMSLGRLSLKLPDTLEELKNHKANILLEEGDYVFLPKKPDYILVLGNVYNQISIRYDEDATVSDYLNRVGGFKSDSAKPYIIHINGEITSNDSKGFFEKSIVKRTLKPGDVIVVPQEVKIPGHIMFVDSLETVVDILFKTTTSILSTNALLTNLGAI